ncbi:CAP domain-containing protein [Acidicapsa dinghuensis]|uniref:CAP domain-containing protein n=1 Tax=Acidicapsa dinghuensis TaxID=2218256 RepID=A0ABW1EGQ8_9BACT|nr:CAP domain-containing protein [Acidicapsa dinghuensis]
MTGQMFGSRIRLITQKKSFVSTPLLLALVVIACMAFRFSSQAQDDPAHAIMDLANQTRSEAGLQPLQWDQALAMAAQAHAERMAREGQLSHQYPEEPSLPERAASAGAHFSLIEENIAMADSPHRVHDSWMHSPDHHDNLMNSRINRIGVGAVRAHGYLFVVADYSQGVDAESFNQVETSVAHVLAAQGLRIKVDGTQDARAYCQSDEAAQARHIFARFLMRWQGPDVTQLPKPLQQRIASGVFHEAAVGACAPQGDGGSNQPVFSGNRVAVLLY